MLAVFHYNAQAMLLRLFRPFRLFRSSIFKPLLWTVTPHDKIVSCQGQGLPTFPTPNLTNAMVYSKGKRVLPSFHHPPFRDPLVATLLTHHVSDVSGEFPEPWPVYPCLLYACPVAPAHARQNNNSNDAHGQVGSLPAPTPAQHQPLRVEVCCTVTELSCSPVKFPLTGLCVRTPGAPPMFGPPGHGGRP